MSLFFYKLGAWLNALVGLTLVGVFTVLQISPHLIFDLFRKLHVRGSMSYLSYAIVDTGSTSGVLIPIIILLAILIMFVVGVVIPFSKVDSAVNGNTKTITSGGFFMTGLVSLPLGGGLLMILAVIFGLRKRLEEKRKVWMFDHNQMNPDALPVDGNYYPEEVYQEEPVYDYAEEAPSYDRRQGVPQRHKEVLNRNERAPEHFPQTKETKELKDRVAHLERRGAYVEDDVYFAQRRDKRRIDNLEQDLESERRRNRR